MERTGRRPAAGSGAARFNQLKPGTNAAYSLLFVLISALCVLPMVFIIIISLSSEASIAQAGYSFRPAEWSLEAYRYVWRIRDASGMPTVVRAFLNSVIVTAGGTVLGLGLISSMAYVLSRRTFRLRRAYTVMVFIPMIFSGGLLSTYVVNTQLLGLENTYAAMILPLCCSSFYVFIMRTFFQTTVPEEIIESGKVDGAGQLRIFARLVLPISLPVLATVALFLTFVYWNDWYQASLYLESGRRDLFPLQFLLVNMELNIQYLNSMDSHFSAGAGQTVPSETIRMAIVVLSVVPIMFSYPFFQKYFVSGLTVGAVKS